MKSLLVLLVVLTICGCGILFYPMASLTIKVTDERGEPIMDAEVGLGSEQGYKNGSPVMQAVTGRSNSKGLFNTKVRTSNFITYGAIKDRYYSSLGEYRFKEKKRWHWEPWNPEVTLVLRKIENPVPMYARQIRDLMLPALNKNIGFDLIYSDWVKPYGSGLKADIYFKVVSNYTSNLEFDGKLLVTAPSNMDGFIITDQKMYGSQYKLPRLAPSEGYVREIVKKQSRVFGKSFLSNIDDNNNYVFRIRTEKNAGGYQSFYGKIRGDFDFLFDAEKASVNFTYYVNPDHTRNLEFDPKRNLFNNLPPTERVAQP